MNASITRTFYIARRMHLLLMYWPRRHDMTSASVIQFPPTTPTTTPTTTPMFPNLNYKIHPNSAIFQARTLKFYMEVDLDNP